MVAGELAEVAEARKARGLRGEVATAIATTATAATATLIAKTGRTGIALEIVVPREGGVGIGKQKTRAVKGAREGAGGGLGVLAAVVGGETRNRGEGTVERTRVQWSMKRKEMEWWKLKCRVAGFW